MNTRAFTLALLIAGFAMFMVYTYVEDQKSGIVKKYGTSRSVVVAKVDIKELELIDDSKVTVIQVPQKFLAPGHFKTIREVENTVAMAPIIKGEQVTKPRVGFPGARTGLSRQVSVGKRAVAIQISDQHAAAKLIKPGDRVDVIASVSYAAGRKDLEKVKTILQNVYVLSTGLSMSNNLPLIGVQTPKVIRKMNLNVHNEYNTVTLELSPYDAQKLIYLKQFSSQPINLSLRNNNDKEKIRINSMKIFDVLGDEDAAEAKGYFIEKYRKKGN